MIICRSVPHLSLIFRSNHNLISVLKNPKKALDKGEVTIKIPKTIRKSCNNDELLSNFPKEFFRKTKMNTTMSRQLYLINADTASKIAKHLTESPSQSITLVEANPGPGILTNCLIQSGIKDLRLFEQKLEFLPHLKKTYVKVYPDRVQLKHADLITLHKMFYKDEMNSTSRLDDLLSKLPTTEWNDDINFRLFGATGSTSFFKTLISSIVFQNSLLALGRCEMYLAVPSILYLTLTSSSASGFAHYRAISILFQIFFEYQLLDKFPRSDFVPPIINTPERASKTATKTRAPVGIKSSEFDPDAMYFMKVVPRRDLLELCPPNEIQELWHFIKVNCQSRTSRIVPLLEKFIPNCGTRLLMNFTMNKPVRVKPVHTVNFCETPPTTNPSMTLSKQDYHGNFNIFTRFGDLQPSEMLTLFNEFRLLPEYSSCNFLPSLENALLKHLHNPEEVVTVTIKQSVSGSDQLDNVHEEQQSNDLKRR